MPDHVIEVSLESQCDNIAARFWRLLCPQLDFYLAFGGTQQELARGRGLCHVYVRHFYAGRGPEVSTGKQFVLRNVTQRSVMCFGRAVLHFDFLATQFTSLESNTTSGFVSRTANSPFDDRHSAEATWVAKCRPSPPLCHQLRSQKLQVRSDELNEIRMAEDIRGLGNATPGPHHRKEALARSALHLPDGKPSVVLSILKVALQTKNTQQRGIRTHTLTLFSPNTPSPLRNNTRPGAGQIAI